MWSLACRWRRHRLQLLHMYALPVRASSLLHLGVCRLDTVKQPLWTCGRLSSAMLAVDGSQGFSFLRHNTRCLLEKQ